MEPEELVKIAHRALASHFMVTKADNFTEKDANMVDFINKGCDTEDDEVLENWLKAIEEHVTK